MAEQGKQVRPAERAGEAQRIVPRTSFDEMSRLMDRMFENFWPGGMMRPMGFGWPELARMDVSVPRVDVIDREEDVLVRAELPGVQKKDLNVSVSDGAVTIKAMAEREQKEEEGEYYRRELSRGAFSRTIALPAEVDAAKAKASFKDGILDLTLPKAERAKPRQVTIE